MRPCTGRLLIGWLLLGLLTALLAAAVPATQASDPIIEVPRMYLPLAARNYPLLLPPPIEAAMEGWLRKWRESATLPPCLQAAGTPYYLQEAEEGSPWLAALVATDAVSEDTLELAIDHRVSVRGVAEYLNAACGFPRMEVRELRVLSGAGAALETSDRR